MDFATNSVSTSKKETGSTSLGPSCKADRVGSKEPGKSHLLCFIQGGVKELVLLRAL